MIPFERQGYRRRHLGPSAAEGSFDQPAVHRQAGALGGFVNEIEMFTVKVTKLGSRPLNRSAADF